METVRQYENEGGTRHANIHQQVQHYLQRNGKDTDNFSNSTRSLILVQRAGISNELGRMVTHRVDFKKDECYKEVTRSLIRLMRDAKKKKENTGGKVSAGGVAGNKIRKSINKRDDDRNRLLCEE